MDVVAVVTSIVGVDLDRADLVAVRGHLRELAAVESWVAARKIAAKRRLDDLGREGKVFLPEVDLTIHGNTTRREVAQVSRRDDALQAVPQMEQALTDGAVSPAHVDALHRALAPLTRDERAVMSSRGEEIVDLARTTTPDLFAHEVRRLAALRSGDDGVGELQRQKRASRLRTWTDPATGMLKGLFDLDAETGAKLTGRLRSLVEQLFHDRLPDGCPTDPTAKQDHLRALAFAALFDETSSPGGAGGRPDLIVVVDVDTLVAGLHDRSIIDIDGDTTLPVETIRRLACTANIIPVVLDSNGVTLDQGHAVRLATRAQRRAMRAMYPTCAIPGCHVPFETCVLHHIRYWEHGGTTDLHNLLPLCLRHHHAAHEAGWTLHLDPHTRHLTITHPNGTTQTTGPPRARAG